MHQWNKEPTLKEFTEAFDRCVDEIGVKSNEEGFINSHKIVGDVRVYCENDDDSVYEIVGLDVEQLMGCGC